MGEGETKTPANQPEKAKCPDWLTWRNSYNTVGCVAGLFGAGLSLAHAFGWKTWPIHNELIVGLWVAIPPIFFWIDWQIFCTTWGNGKKPFTKDELDSIGHTHDLSRNLWLALIAILAFRFGIQLGGG